MNTNTTDGATWREVRVCPVCGHARWCRQSPGEDFVACRRQPNGAIRRIDYRDGGVAWLHRVGAAKFAPSATLPPAQPDMPRAPDKDLDAVYRVLLAAPDLRLRRDHRDHLLARGLAVADLERDGFRSLPPVCRAGILRQLRERFREELLVAVPGIIGRDGPHGRYLTLAGRAGIIIPVYSAARYIVGLVIRPDDPSDDKKYVWLSSKPYGGPTPGARAHVPAGVGPAYSIRLVEGTLKANVAHALGGEAIIGLPGNNVGPEAIATLRALGAQEALLALDADVRVNAHVAKAQLRGLQMLKSAGLEAGLVRWDPQDGKGYDDLLLARRKAVH